MPAARGRTGLAVRDVPDLPAVPRRIVLDTAACGVTHVTRFGWGIAAVPRHTTQHVDIDDGQPVDENALRTLDARTARCRLHRYHRPRPLRLVIHHILPKAHGGTDDPDNLAIVCDTGHYNVHNAFERLLDDGGHAIPCGTRSEWALAREGFNRRR